MPKDGLDFSGLPDQNGMRLRAYGGAEVVRGFRMGGRQVMRGEKLTADELYSMNRSNLNSLINNGYVHPFPSVTREDLPEGERFLIRRTDLKYDVVQGVRVNAEPLTTKAEAEALLEGAGAL